MLSKKAVVNYKCGSQKLFFPLTNYQDVQISFVREIYYYHSYCSDSSPAFGTAPSDSAHLSVLCQQRDSSPLETFVGTDSQEQGISLLL